jgi:3-oxoacyl-[acyl-carrier protein] reductase
MTTRRVLVTGSSRGIGKAIALRLAADGFMVTLHGRSASDEMNELASTISGNVLNFDVRDRDTCRQVLERDLADRGSYYGIVCNAGIARDGAFPALTYEDWDAVVKTSLDGFYNVLHPLVMPMVRSKQGGRIVTISSVSGIIGNRGQVNYSAAKAGIIGATKALAVELASRSITVNCVAPGLIDTDMTANLPTEEIAKMIPMNRIGSPDDVAATVGFLMSDAAGYITRQVIGVNGGLV